MTFNCMYFTPDSSENDPSYNKFQVFKSLLHKHTMFFANKLYMNAMA